MCNGDTCFTRFCFQLSFPRFVKHTTTSTSCLFWSKHVSFPNMMPILLHMSERGRELFECKVLSWATIVLTPRCLQVPKTNLWSPYIKSYSQTICLCFFFFFVTLSMGSTNKHPKLSISFIFTFWILRILLCIHLIKWFSQWIHVHIQQVHTFTDNF